MTPSQVWPKCGPSVAFLGPTTCVAPLPLPEGARATPEGSRATPGHTHLKGHTQTTAQPTQGRNQP